MFEAVREAWVAALWSAARLNINTLIERADAMPREAEMSESELCLYRAYVPCVVLQERSDAAIYTYSLIFISIRPKKGKLGD